MKAIMCLIYVGKDIMFQSGREGISLQSHRITRVQACRVYRALSMAARAKTQKVQDWLLLLSSTTRNKLHSQGCRHRWFPFHFHQSSRDYRLRPQCNCHLLNSHCCAPRALRTSSTKHLTSRLFSYLLCVLVGVHNHRGPPPVKVSSLLPPWRSQGLHVIRFGIKYFTY